MLYNIDNTDNIDDTMLDKVPIMAGQSGKALMSLGGATSLVLDGTTPKCQKHAKDENTYCTRKIIHKITTVVELCAHM